MHDNMIENLENIIQHHEVLIKEVSAESQELHKHTQGLHKRVQRLERKIGKGPFHLRQLMRHPKAFAKDVFGFKFKKNKWISKLMT